MITFLVDGHEVELSRDTIEAAAQAVIADQIGTEGRLSQTQRLALKGVADVVLNLGGLKAPRGANKLEYLAAYVLHMAMDYLDGKALPVEGAVHKVAQAEAVADGPTD